MPQKKIIKLDGTELRQAFDYFPDTGDIINRATDRPATRLWRGENGKCYRYMVVGKSQVRAHRVAWCMFHGSISSEMYIDHVNGNGADNRILNLRLVTLAENQKNQRLPADNTTGRIGVSWRKDCEKFHATGKVGGCRVHLGYFDNIADASIARDTFELAHGYHTNHGSKRAL